MLLSLFTPTHKFEFLPAAYASLCENVLPEGVEWEWLLLVNNVAPGVELPEAIRADPRVRVIHGDSPTQTIGGLKREACRHCRGEWLIEFDHDDMLFPNALQCIAAAAQSNPNAVFLYSDAVHFYHDQPGCEIFGAVYGWESYPAIFRNKPYTAMRSFPVNASSLHSIGSAPDHVRCWRRDFYEKIGGHDVTLLVCDDLDLMCRTFLAGGEMFHIQKPLYMYRVYANNSYKLNQDKVHQLDTDTGNKYRHAMIAEWCRRENLAMLDLGGAFNSPAGYTAVDLHKPAKIIHDIVKNGLPVLEQELGCVRAVDFLEHVPACNSRCDHKECTVGLMNNIYDRLVPGGWLLSSTPSGDGRGAYQDPTHSSVWVANSWWYYCHPFYRKFIHGLYADFQPRRIVDTIPTEFHRQHNIPYIVADVVARKGQHDIIRHWPIPIA